MYTSVKFIIFFWLFCIVSKVFGQAPVITYATPNVYTVGTAILPLNPTNIGGAVPPNIYGQVTTLAGNGAPGNLDGMGANASFNYPSYIAIDGNGNLFVVDAGSHLIRKVTPTGNVITFAGNSSNFFSNGQGTEATFGEPTGIAIDVKGDIYVSDQGFHMVRKITPGGMVTTFAGNGANTTADGDLINSSFQAPVGIAFNKSGNMFIADHIANLIRKITPAGIVSTFAGDGTKGSLNGLGLKASFFNLIDLVIDNNDNLYATEQQGENVRKITPNAEVTTFAGTNQSGRVDGPAETASFYFPTGEGIDHAGNLYVADQQNNTIRKITPAGYVSTIAGNANSGNIDGIGTTASFYNTHDVVPDNLGNLYVADIGNHEIRKISITGYTIDKTLPAGLTFDAATGMINGTPISASPPTNYTVTAYNTSGSSSFTLNIEVKVNVIPPVTVAPPNISYKTPNIYTVNKVIPALTPKNTGGPVPATFYGQVTTFVGGGKGDYFNNPTRLAQDVSGNLYLADRDNNLIKKITPEGVVTVLASGFNQPNGVTIDSKGNIFVADAASNQIKKVTSDGTVSVFAGSGSFGSMNGPAGSASFYYPYSVVADKDDNLYVADSQNNLIRKITPAGDVSTLAGSGGAGFADGVGILASFYNPSGVNVDAIGNVYVADPYNYRVRKITSDGTVTTIAGSGGAGSDNGVALSSTFNVPAGVAVDAAGNIYVADISNNLIRKIDPQGIVTTLAGNLNPGAADGIGALASFNHPNDVQVNPNGFLYVTDYGNSLVRKVVVTGYTIDKVLPDGLKFDPTTGIITGTPTVTWPATDYLVTAYNTGGSSSFTVNIKVTEVGGTIFTSAVTGNISNCESVASASYQQFTASGTLLSQDIKVKAPASFLVSLSPTGRYSSSITLALSGDKVNPVTIYVKLDDNAVAGNYAGNVILLSAGANDILVAVSGGVRKLPVVDPVSDQPGICSGATVTINFMGTADVYSWINSDARIGLAASGTGDFSFKAQNNTSAPIIATIIITPNSTSGVCPGKAVTFNITVTPSATPLVDIKQVNVTCPGQMVIFSATSSNARC